MSIYDSHQLSSYNSDTLSWANEVELNESNELNELNESNELNELNTSNILEDVHNLDAESDSNSLDQPPLSGVTITNSLDKRVRKKKNFTYSKKLNSRENKDSLKKECSNDYKLSTGTGNLKAHLHQIYKILPSEENNQNQSVKIASNQLSLHDFINKKTSLPTSKQNKITNHVLA
ncbi:415_t:CDS:2 [Dentiscutata erythropus]|uniref:415_t:CDS:1 n=1 Tax=Dentiscutata erythropus TaxID=1348616 RepID=A0A9N9JYQ7_9GLOM|nr:415_t:CDS:2 [Dentiscutata erythropus]